MLVRRQLTLLGVHNYAPWDLVAAVRFLEMHLHAYPFAHLIGPRFPLAQADEAFRQAALGHSARVAIVFPTEGREAPVTS
jgi:hypothetical protein